MVFAAGFVIVKVITEVPLIAIGFVPNDLTIVGGATTVVEVLAVLPVPPFVEVIVPVVLFLAPADVPVMVTLNIQLLFAAIEPPVSAIVSAAGELSVVFNVPPHCVEDELETSRPVGNVSENAIPLRVVAFEFVIV